MTFFLSFLQFGEIYFFGVFWVLGLSGCWGCLGAALQSADAQLEPSADIGLTEVNAELEVDDASPKPEPPESKPRPIGIFDSGVGGLTVAAALLDLLPNEDIVYFGDTARYPYGNKSAERVRQAASQVAGFLVDEFDAKLLVVACNTASAVCLAYGPPGDAARTADAAADLTDQGAPPPLASPSVPVVGVIEPGVQALAKVREFRRVGVIATTGTIASGAYQQAMRQAAPEMELTCLACPGFVEFVERGEADSQQTAILARRLLAPLIDAKVEALLLGCTHYPFLARTIGQVMGPDVVLVSSADETAFAVRQVLEREGLLRESRPRESRPRGSPSEPAAPTRRWIVSGQDRWFKELGAEQLGLPIDTVEVRRF